MKRRNLTAFLAMLLTALVALAPRAAAQQPDPAVAALGARIALDRMHADVGALVSIETRRSDKQGGFDAQDWVFARFQALGYADLRLQEFRADLADNVIATLPGLVAPDEIYVLGAHYDSINEAGAGEPAPGADDNATGVSALLEAARVVAESGVRFEASIVFVAFAAEEFSRMGSKAFVDEAIAEGRPPRYGLVMDVLGYLQPESTLDLSIGTSEEVAGTDQLVDAATGAIETYLPGYAWEFGLNCT